MWRSLLCHTEIWHNIEEERAPACPGHIWTINGAVFNSTLFEVPMNSGANHTLANNLLRFIEGSNEEVMLIDDIKYPDN